MRPEHSGELNASAERVMKGTRRAARGYYLLKAIGLRLEDLRGNGRISELYRKEGIAQSLYCTSRKRPWKLVSGAW